MSLAVVCAPPSELAIVHLRRSHQLKCRSLVFNRCLDTQTRKTGLVEQQLVFNALVDMWGGVLRLNILMIRSHLIWAGVKNVLKNMGGLKRMDGCWKWVIS